MKSLWTTMFANCFKMQEFALCYRNVPFHCPLYGWSNRRTYCKLKNLAPLFTCWPRTLMNSKALVKLICQSPKYYILASSTTLLLHQEQVEGEELCSWLFYSCIYLEGILQPTFASGLLQIPYHCLKPVILVWERWLWMSFIFNTFPLTWLKDTWRGMQFQNANLLLS